ncbi:MAG: DNA-binding response OmpR family regulator, partial [Pirellulaceae bacterium]
MGMAIDAPKLLIVDDDPVMTRLLSKWLEKAGYDVRCVYNGRDAISAIEDECPHVLITDWEMPVMDGLELCSWLREQQLPHYVYTLFVTARCCTEDMLKGLHAGADDFLKKPIDKCELLARIQSGRRVIDLERRLSQLAKYDSLTGLATQGTFFDEL